MQFPIPKVATLSNGIRVVLMCSTDTAAVKVKAQYVVGSRHEPDTHSGISHFIEHMVWRGCAKWPEGQDLYRALDALGAESNAYTDREDTAYWIKLLGDQLPFAIEVLADILIRPRFNAQHMETERSVILSEAQGRRDDKTIRCYDLMYNSMYPMSGLGGNIIGSDETINSIDRRILRSYWRQHYVADNMIMVLSGRFDESQAVQLFESHFGGQAVRQSGRPMLANDSASQRPPVSLAGPHFAMLRQEEAQQAYISIGFESFGREHQLAPAMMVLSNIMGDTMSSRLCIRVRDDAGMAYSIYSYPSLHRGTGQFVIEAGLDMGRLHEAVELILTELADVRQNGVTGAELDAAKANLRGSMALGYESAHDVADHYAEELLLSDRPETLNDELSNFEAVTEEDVQQVADQLFRASRLHAGVVSPFDDSTRLNELSRILGS